MRLLTEHLLAPEAIIIDGCVDLGVQAKPGLGRYLYGALGGSVPILGVAKRPLKEAAVGHRPQVMRHVTRATAAVQDVVVPDVVVRTRGQGGADQ